MTEISLRPTKFELFLTVAATLLLVVVIAAIARAPAHWAEVSRFVWAHLLTIVFALILTPIMLLMPRGTPLHRQLGWAWMIAMFCTVLLSMFVRQINHGHFWFIHLLSLYVMYSIPRTIWMAKTHRIQQHRVRIQGIVAGALLISGIFTFPFGRMLGVWLMGH